MAVGLLVLVVALVGAGLVLSSGMGAAQESADDESTIESCGVEISNGSTKHVLTGDLEGTGTCVNVDQSASGATIDGNGHEIRYTGSGESIGIEVQADDVTVQNVTVVGWEDGIYTDAVQNAAVEDVTVRDSSRWGYRLSESTDVTVSDSQSIDNEQRGIRLLRTDGAVLSNVTVRGSGEEGVYAQGGSTVTIERSDVSDNPGFGIRGFQADFEFDDVAARSNTNQALALNESGATATAFDVGSSTDPGTTLDFAAENVWMDAATDPEPGPENWTEIGRYFSAGEHVGAPSIDVELHYDESDSWVVNESTLTVFRDDDPWTELQTSVDESNRTVATSLRDGDSFGTFGAFGQGESFFDVAIESAPDAVLVNETATIEATITNNGSVNDTQTVGLTVDGDPLENATLVNETTVTLDGDENQTETFEWTPTERGSYNATVASENTSDTAQIDAELPANFEVDDLDVSDSVVQGENLTVAANVTNAGDQPDKQSVELSTGDDVVDTTPLELNGSETESVELTWTNVSADGGTYEATLSTRNDSLTANVTVLEPADFTVELVDAPETVVQGENLTVTANVTNSGDVNGTQSIDLDVSDDVGWVNGTNVTLSGGESVEVALTWQSVADAGEYTLTASSDDDEDSAPVTVLTPANFTITDVESDSSVLTGEPLHVTATVENTGEANGTQTVDLTVDDGVGQADNTTLTLTGNESREVNLTWTDTDGNRGEHDVTVASDDDSLTRLVDVEDPAFFDVEVVEATDPVLGDQLNVTANVTNTGDREGTQTIDLSLNRTVGEVDDDSVTVGPNESENVTLTWDTTGANATTYEANVSSANTSDRSTITVLEPAYFAIQSLDADDRVAEGENLSVAANVSNTGDVSGSQDVSLSVGGYDTVTSTVDLDAGDTKTVSFDWSAPAESNGTYNVTVRTDEERAERELWIQTPPEFVIDGVDATSAVEAGGDLEVEATVENLGEATGSQAITLDVSNVSGQRDEQSVTLEGGQNRTVTLVWSTTDGDVGNYTAVVASDDDNASVGVTVEEPEDDDDEGGLGIAPPDSSPGSPFDVQVTDTNSPVSVGGTLFVRATITNEGDERNEDTATLTANGDVRDSTAVALDAGESETVRLEWSTGSGDEGSHSVSVDVDGASGTTWISVGDDPSFAVTVESTTSPVVERQPLVVNATIEANVDDEQTIELSNFEGETVASETVELAAGESRAISLVWTPEIGDAGSGFLPVDAADDSAVTEVTVQETPPFAVAVGGSNSPVEAGDPLTVDVRVTNEGDEERTGYLTLEDGGDLTGGAATEDGRTAEASVRDGRPVTLDAGESRTVTLEWQTDAADVGQRDLLVDVGADQERVSVTVEAEASGLLGVGPEWTGSVVDYEPTEQTRHVGVFLWLTVIVGALAAYVLVTRETMDARLLGVTLLVAALRTGTDVLHATVGGITTEPLLALNTALELYVGLLFLVFAASYVGNEQLLERRSLLGITSVAGVGTAMIASNGVHGLVFSNVMLAEAPFTYVTADTGPLGWLILTATLAALLFAVGLLVQSFLEGTDPTWRPVGVLATGLCLAIVFVLLSVLDRGPLPHYDYTGAGMAGFLAVTTTTLFGHGLQRIKHNAQQSLIEDLDDPIVIANDARIVVDFNAAAAELLPGIAMGEQFDRLVAYSPEWPAPGDTTTAEESRSGLLPSRRAPASDGTAIEAVNSEHAERDVTADSEVHYLVQTTSVTADTADSIGYTVRFTDVTELKRRTNELARKNAQLEQVASTISHDLRNPLSVADGYVDLIEQSVPPASSGAAVQPAAVADHLDPIVRAVDRMSTIIDDILALARGDETVTETEAVEYGDLVQEAWATVDTDEATLFVDSTGLIDADPRRLRRILENLFRNAVEHAGEDVAVVTGITEDGFYVADDGPGISPAEREAIFEEGYSSAADGTGLGLAIVTQLASAHEWDVELDPEYDGARFVFSGCTTLSEHEQSMSGAIQQD